MSWPWKTRACFTICCSPRRAQTLLEIASDPKHLGAEIGLIAILHTWGQNLLLHPHIHCVIPAGGLSPDHQRWIRPRYPFFLPVKVLSRVFRGKFLAGLETSPSTKKLQCAGPAAALADRQQFAKLAPSFTSPRLGRLRQARLRRSHAGAALSRSLHPSRRHLQSPPVGLRPRARHLPLEGLRPRWQARSDDTWPPPSSCAASFCTCCPRASSASGTSAFSPIAFEHPVWRWADNCWPTVARIKLEHTTCLRGSSLWHCPQCGASMIVIQRFTAAELSTCTYFDSS